MAKTKKKPGEKEKFACQKCGVQLSSSYNLKIHCDTDCGTIKNFSCEICLSLFLTPNSLKTHMSLHTGEKKFVCSYCGNSYLSKGQLKVHERSHTKEKSFVCNVCGKGFCHRESLVTHSTIHTGIKPYLCESCSSTFSCIGNLLKHRKVRPNSCGLPIYSVKKIAKRAGVKCKGSSPKIIIDNVVEIPQEEVADEPLYESQIVEADQVEAYQDQVLVDHQYVAFSHHSQEPQLEDYSKKEMDVFDYIGIEIRNIEEREKEEQMKNVFKIEEFDVKEITEEEFVIEACDVGDELVTEEEATAMDCVYEITEVSGVTESLSEHVDFEGANFRCKLCPKIYQKVNITVKHLKVEHDIIIPDYNYDNTNRYRKPQKKASFKCKFCPRRYTSIRVVARHEKLHGPNGDLLYKCSCCQLYFRTTTEQADHQFAEHEDRLACKADGCGKRFDHPEKLVSHSKYAHTDKKKLMKKYVFVCQLCGRSFNTKVALSDHERSNCGKIGIYQCMYCDKNYHSAGSLKCHLTIHTKTLDFECSFCAKKFRTKGQLTIHLRSHTKEKNFKCTHCPAEFSHRESLLTHNTLHTGIKRFECSSCHSRFSCISNLLAHRKSHKNTCGGSQINKVQDADNSVKMCKSV